MPMRDARLQYNYANKLATKYYKDAINKNKDPYVLALDDIVNTSGLSTKYIGIIDIPTSLIVGTKNTARKKSFAGNFMPLLNNGGEFSFKWCKLCDYHYSDLGITDPIKAYEYEGKFYVEEGNKRVSVLKSFDAPYITGEVTRIIPKVVSEEYSNLINFFNITGLYELQFKKQKNYNKFFKLLSLSKNTIWDKRLRASVIGLYSRFVEVIQKHSDNDDYADYFVKWLESINFYEAKYLSDKKIKQSIENCLPSILYNVAINPRDIKLKILCIGDETDPSLYDYYSKDKTEDYDLILSTGDLNKEYLEFIVTSSNKKLIYVLGNHDKEDIEGCICAEDNLIIVNGIRILGLGGSCKYSQGANQYTEFEMMIRILKLIPKIKRAGGIDIILSHVPLRGYGDLDDYAHRGFKCFKYLLDKYEPKYLIHGHIHMNYSNDIKRIVEYKNTKIINSFIKYSLDY